MSHLNEKVSYLRGLMEGMKLDTSTNEGKVLTQIVELLDSVACEIADIAEAHEELSEYVDSIDQDLDDLENVFDEAFDIEEDEDFDDDDDVDEDEDFDGDDDVDEDEDFDEDEEDFEDEEDLDDVCDGDCAGCSGCEDEEYDGEIFVECMCTECKGTFYVKEDELADDAFHICPRCGARIHVVLDYEADIPVAALADDEGEVE